MLPLRSHDSSLFEIPAILLKLPSDRTDQHVFTATFGVVHDKDEALGKIVRNQLHRAQSIQSIITLICRRAIDENKVVANRSIEVGTSVVTNGVPFNRLG